MEMEYGGGGTSLETGVKASVLMLVLRFRLFGHIPRFLPQQNIRARRYIRHRTRSAAGNSATYVGSAAAFDRATYGIWNVILVETGATCHGNYLSEVLCDV